MNDTVSRPVTKPVTGSYAGTFTWVANQRSWGSFSGKISSIRRPTEIIMFICEDELTIDDGIWQAQPYQWGTSSIQAIAARHSTRKKIKGPAAYGSADPNENGVGNVSFCDGHVETLSRVDALRGKYSGNPYPDPDVAPFKQ